jgi:hypothetical protein
MQEVLFEFSDYHYMSPENTNSAASSSSEKPAAGRAAESPAKLAVPYYIDMALHPSDTGASMISMIKERLDSPPVATLMRVTAEIIPVQAQESDIQQLVQLASSSVSHPVQASDGSMNPADIYMRGKYVRSENHQVDQTIPLPITPVRPMNLAPL